MKTETVSQTGTEHKTMLISFYREHAIDILKIMRDCTISYRQLGEDQASRLVYEITYNEVQLSNIAMIRKGISELERTANFAKLLVDSISRLLS